MTRNAKKKIRIHWGRLVPALLLVAVLTFAVTKGAEAIFRSTESGGQAQEQKTVPNEGSEETEDPAAAAARAAEEAARQAAAEAAQKEAENAQMRLEAYQNGYLLLLNKENAVASDYVPSDLTSIAHSDPGKPEETHYLREEAAAAFEAMMEAAQADGYTIKMTTGYRSYGYQSALYSNYVTKYGQEKADTFSARPGTSEHQSGLASDISCESLSWGLKNAFGTTPEGQWIQEHCAEYGFIVRYPQDTADGRTSQERTGYVYEPWHVRYVTPFCAREMAGQGLVLEEYLAQYDWETGYAVQAQ